MADNENEVLDDLNEEFEEEMDDATVITVPIDTTLSNSGEAADAKAVGDALALKADASSITTIDVNGQSADLQGHIIVNGTEIAMSDTDETTLKDAIDSLGGKTGATIPINSEPEAQTIEEAIAEIGAQDATTIMMGPNSTTSVSQKISAMDSVAAANSSAITALQAKTAETILMKSGETETVKEAVEKRVKTINGEQPDENGNMNINSVQWAENMISERAQAVEGFFTIRTSAIDASIDNSGWLLGVKGNSTHTGFVAEELEMEVQEAEEAGHITAVIDRDIFVTEVSTSGTITLTYTTEWSANPENYGVTVTGEPVNGDKIVITYVKEARGTIDVATPSTFIATGWNLYDNSVGYARVVKYSDEYGFRISGTYTTLKYSETETGTKSDITVTSGTFTVPGDGFVWVTGGNSTDTAIWMAWGDWSSAYPGNFSAYTQSEIDLSDVMDEVFPYGLLKAGSTRDEIDLNLGIAYSRVERQNYSEANRAAAEASGREYEFDEDYIYLALAEEQTTSIELDGGFVANDHGLEMFAGTDVDVWAQALYGQNLKNKLERDVLTISQQTLTSSQKAQVQGNLNVPDASSVFGLTSISNVTDANNTNLIGRLFALGTSCANLPTATNAYYTVLCFGSTQIAIRYNSGYLANAVYMRSFVNNSWKGWEEVGRRKGNITVSSITAASGFSASTAEVQVSGNMGIIQYNGLTTSTTASGWTKVGTIGDSVVAYKRTWGYLMCDNSMSSGRSSVAECRVNTDGTIEVYNPQGGEKYWGGFAFFLG